MTNLIKALQILDNDLDALGWDNPAQLYEIQGDFINDPVFVKRAELTDPRGQLERLVASGMEAPEGTIGMVLAAEAWRPATMEEAAAQAYPDEQKYIDMATEMAAEVRAQGRDEQFIQQAWMKSCLAMAQEVGGIANLPHALRIEIRTLIAVSREGIVSGVLRSKNKDIAEPTDAMDVSNAGEIPKLMVALMGGKV
jgi:hypothetical protein